MEIARFCTRGYIFHEKKFFVKVSMANKVLNISRKYVIPLRYVYIVYV